MHGVPVPAEEDHDGQPVVFCRRLGPELQLQMPKLVFVLLHGAWHTPRCWDRLIAQLDAAGYTSVAPALPSSGSNPPTPDWSRDVETIRDTVSDLIWEHNVVVVAHSFSGMTCGTALEGLVKQASLSKGFKGSVVRLVYIAAFLVPEGFQHSPRGARDNMVPQMKTDLEAGIITVAPQDAKGLFYQDVDDTIVSELAKDLQPQSFASFWSTTTYAAWRTIPTTYIICMGDKPSTVAAIEYLIETAKASGKHRIENIIRHDVGHSPFISQPEWLANVLIEEADREA